MNLGFRVLLALVATTAKTRATTRNEAVFAGGEQVMGLTVVHILRQAFRNQGSERANADYRQQGQQQQQRLVVVGLDEEYIIGQYQRPRDFIRRMNLRQPLSMLVRPT